MNDIPTEIRASRDCLMRFQFDAAERHLDRVLTTHPHHRGALLGKIDAALARGAHDTALTRVDQALTILPDDGAILLRKANILRMIHMPRPALALAEQALKQAPDKPQAHLELIAALKTLGELVSAERQCHTLLALHPSHPGGLLARIDIALHRGDGTGAMAVIDTVPGDLPRDALFLVRKSRAFRMMFRNRDAREVMTQALSAAPNDPRLLMELAATHKALRDMDAAKRNLNSILDTTPNNLDALLQLATLSPWRNAQCQNTISDRTPAWAHDRLQAMVQAQPFFARAHTTLGDLYIREGLWRQAQTCWAAAVQCGDHNRRRAIETAECQLNLAETTGVETTARDFLHDDPANIRARSLLAKLLLMEGRIEEYLDWQQAMTALEGVHLPVTRKGLILDLMMRGDPTANDLLRHCIQDAETRPNPGLIGLLLSTDQPREAISLCHKWQHLAPQSPEIALKVETIRTLFPSEDQVPMPSPSPLDSPTERPAKNSSAPPLPAQATRPHPSRGTECTLLAWRASNVSCPFPWWLDKVRAATTPSPATMQRAHAMPPAITAPILTELREMAALRQPFLLAATHCGPYIFSHLIKFFPEIKCTRQGINRLHTDTDSAHTIFSRGDKIKAAQQLVHALQQGVPVMTASDVPLFGAPRPGIGRANGTLFGVPVAVTNMIPKLSREFGIPSYWAVCSIKNGKTSIELDRLPDPQPDELPQTWYDRWAKAYLGRLEQVMAGNPENLDLGFPLWRYLLLNGAMDKIASSRPTMPAGTAGLLRSSMLARLWDRIRTRKRRCPG